jgi:hypothetical protein
MRINYSDDEDFPGQFGLWQGNCQRSMRGKAGQAALRELEAALVAWPSKRLGRELFVERAGAACALGVLAVARKQQEGVSLDEALSVLADKDPEDMEQHGEDMGLPRLVVWAIVAQNDVEMNGRYVTAEGPSQEPYGWYSPRGISLWVDYSPEERYEKVLAWVRSNLVLETQEREAGR